MKKLQIKLTDEQGNSFYLEKSDAGVIHLLDYEAETVLVFATEKEVDLFSDNVKYLIN